MTGRHMGKGSGRERRSPLCPQPGLLSSSHTLAGLFAPPVPGKAREEGEGSVPDSHHGHGSQAEPSGAAAGVTATMASQCSCPAPRPELTNKFTNRSCSFLPQEESRPALPVHPQECCHQHCPHRALPMGMDSENANGEGQPRSQHYRQHLPVF